MPAKEKQTLVDQAYAEVKRRIRSNEMPSGFNVPEQELAESLGFSRTPVREALIRLEAEGLVEIIPRRGVRVIPIRTEDMREIYDLLSALEPFAARRLAELKPDATALAPIEQAVVDMETAVQDKDLDGWAEADDRFHRELLRVLGNKRLIDFSARLNDQAHRARMLTLRLREVPRKSTIEQRAIFDALKTGDSDAVETLFKTHRERVSVELMDILEHLKIPQI